MILKPLKQLVEFFLICFFLLIPGLSYSEQTETKISADTVTVSPDGMLKASGNVVVKYGQITVKAEALSFNQKINSISVKEISEFYDGQEIKFSADKADLDGELSEGIIFAARILLDEAIKIRAEQVRLDNSGISSAKGISRVTSCEECEDKDPNWYLTASSAKRDFENSNIIYRNVTLRVKGLPVAYLPFLRMPDPTVDRAQGFLVPEAALTSNLATGLKLPYFVPIGLSRDILLTPYFSTKTNTFEYRYRQKFTNGDLVLNGSISNDELIKNKWRYFSRAVGSFDMLYDINIKFDLGKVGDDSYLGDYVYSEESDFNSEINLGKTVVKKHQFFDGNLSYLKEKEQGSALDEYFALSGSYSRDISSVKIPGKLRLSANLNSSLNVNDDNSFSRPPSSAQVGANYDQVSFAGPIQFSQNVFGNYNSFVNSADAGVANEEFSFQYGASSLMSIPLYKKGIGVNTIFTPKFSVSVNGQENDIMGDFFIGSDELSWGNVYSGKKISSLSESEEGVSLSIGLEHEVFWKNNHKMKLWLAAAKIGGLTYTPIIENGLMDSNFNYLGAFSYSKGKAKNLSSNTLFSANGKLLHGDFRGAYASENIELKGNYEYLNHAIDSRLQKDLKTFDFISSYNFLDSLNVDIGGLYDVTLDKMAKASIGLGISLGYWQYNINQEYLEEESDKFSLSAIYDDECTRLNFSFENRYQELGASEPVKSLTFRVQLKPFANFVVSQGADQIIF